MPPVTNRPRAYPIRHVVQPVGSTADINKLWSTKLKEVCDCNKIFKHPLLSYMDELKWVQSHSDIY